MARVAAHRTRHGRFASFKKFAVQMDTPQCRCGAVAEPRHVTVCPINWKVTREAKEKYKIETEEELYKFFVGKGHRGAGVRDWLPRLVG